ncbi:unnamed protein product [Lupinus luteus]|uniref:Serine-threonine/tyrosine-protein kinase catalytic domain-containing protein n=1 Tax=Lupinus luteus TaxID=3873 RepID=A0AAV1WJS1_LUPLU
MGHVEYIAYVLAMVTVSIILIVLGVVLILVCKKKPIESKEIIPVKLYARAYPLTSIDAATDGFNQRRIVGQGRLGTVYAGSLEKQELVAVKRIHPFHVLSNAGSGFGFGFSSVLKWLSLAQHPNIVPIIGFSEAPAERVILMEFVHLESLNFYMQDGASRLDWNKRVSDYGLNFLAPMEKRGLVGYVDDEYWNVKGGGGATKESDVYGLGVVLLELLSGRECEGGLLVKWALPLIKEMSFSELLDPRLVIPSDMRPLVRLAKVASTCVGNTRKCRPSMAQVATILNNLETQVCL